MLKDIINKNIGILKNKKDDPMKFNLKGKLTIIGEKDGEVFHYDEGDNVVTIWAKHSTMHLLTSETYSTHGNSPSPNNPTETMISGRSISGSSHTLGVNNLDGTLVSGDQYLGDNVKYHDGTNFRHFNRPNNIAIDNIAGDSNDGFIYPFFPTKMLFGTGVEFANWDEVRSAGRDGPESDITSYLHPKNGSWTENSFNNMIGHPTNYYSNIWNNSNKRLTQARTVNDVYSGILYGDPPAETDFAIPGAIKDATYTGTTDFAKLEQVDGKFFASGSHRGVGRPSFVYATRGRFFREGSESRLQLGSTSGTEHLESKITFTVVMPEQPAGEFYPYNGYILKIAGLYCDARMLLGNRVPLNNYVNAPTETDLTEMEYSNYQKMPGGIMWAKRKIAPIYKSHDVKVTAQWTIYLP